ncbi:MAG: methylaspartate mutase [Firmicutes bacterium]|nr:methylaspartate mutase [Bacillota bacterium]
MPVAAKNVTSILATDVGSTTTKAILIEKKEDGYHLVQRGEMPTTVEKPWENVMVGVRKAIRRVQELEQRPFLEGDDLIRPKQGNRGVDVYVSTSSAGGGLQMMVCGLVKSISATSAHRAALGAGAVVLDVIAVDDERLDSEKISRISQLRPDIILMSGGVDGGSVTYLAAVAELITQANPQPRFGKSYKIPLVYAGNVDAQDLIESIAGEMLDVHLVENLRPSHDVENLAPARDTIHQLFMDHVMAQAPGYEELMEWVDSNIMPTPGAVGRIISLMAEKYNANIVGVDIGGATTDVFSAFEGTFTRTVSANLGMSYSVTNVLEEAGFENIRKWIPFTLNEEELCNWISNKMVRPTTIPHTLDSLMVEHAIAREALRLSFDHHKSLAKKVEKEQVQSWKKETQMFLSTGEDIIDMIELDMLVGSGGVLSHAPRRAQAMMMLLDAFLPEGITELAVDSIFMMPHLGVLSTIYPDIATEVFDRDCLIRLGTAVCPVGRGRNGQKVMTVKVTMPDGTTVAEEAAYGDLKVIKVPGGGKVKAEITPERGFDVGAGRGRKLERELEAGLAGIVLDARGRPFSLPESESERVAKLTQWIEALQVYDIEKVRHYQEQFPVKEDTAAATKGGKKDGGFLARLFGRK